MKPLLSPKSVSFSFTTALFLFLSFNAFSQPMAPMVGTPGMSPTNNQQPTWTWESGGGGGAGFYRYGYSEGIWISEDVAETSYTPASNLSEGTYILYVQERDASMVWSASGLYEIDIDITPPTVTITSTAISPTNLTLIPITISFSENIGSFNDFNVTW